jgi:hypothetical protein
MLRWNALGEEKEETKGRVRARARSALPRPLLASLLPCPLKSARETIMVVAASPTMLARLHIETWVLSAVNAEAGISPSGSRSRGQLRSALVVGLFCTYIRSLLLARKFSFDAVEYCR